VTPKEFRFTLIKIGVVIPEKISRDIFDIFDTNNDGQIDFDEFAMWVMNSEFKTKKIYETKNILGNINDENLRIRLLKYIINYPDILKLYSVKMTHEILNDYLNKKSKFLEIEVKRIFEVLNSRGGGPTIDVSDLQNW
jgi:Ca2+-binding EF-hand superfamily protein